MNKVANFFVLLFALVFNSSLLAGGGATSDDPEEERKLLKLAPGFQIELVACEPAIVNPVQMNFDPQGRLWVLCIPRYPQLLPGQDRRDQVVVLENPYEKNVRAKVFAEGLMVPTGLAPGDGGVYVGEGDKLLHFKDTTGAGKADLKRVLLTGFGTQDTHHTLNSFRWGPDGSLYFNQGVYIKSTVETPYGPRKYFGGGIWQLRPDRLKLEVYDRSIQGNNTWGHVFDAWGQSFLSSAWPDGINLVLPDSPLNNSAEKGLVPPLPLTRVGDGRHSGLEQITGRHFPDDWQNNLVSGNFNAQQIYRYQLQDDGQKYVAKQLAPLLVSSHRKFRPVDVKLGPDGALYVADWYDEIIQHNQVDFRDPRRDHSRGRIWRITAKDRPLVAVPKLVGVPINAVLDELKSPEPWTRLHAKLALRERDTKEVATRLAAWVARLDAKDPQLPHHLLEALWTYQALDIVEPSLLTRVLRSEEPKARAAATRVLGAWADQLEQPLRLLAPQATDASARVRLESAMAASRIPSAGALETVLRSLDQPIDPLLDFSLRKTAQVLRPYWYPEFHAGKFTFEGKTKPLTFALQSIRAVDAVPTLTRLYQTGKVPAESQTDVLSILAALGGPDQQSLVFERALDAKGLKSTERARLLETLETAARERKTQPKADLTQVAALFAADDPLVAGAGLRLAGAWKLESLREMFVAKAEDNVAAVRRSALAALVDLGGVKSLEQLKALAESKKAYEIRRDAITGLVSLDAKQAAELAGQLLQAPLTASDDPGPLFLAFANRTGGAASLALALKSQKPSADAAKIGLRALLNSGAQTPALADALKAATGVAGQARILTPQELQRLISLVKTDGDPHRGEAIFRRTSLGCQQCHAIAGAGSNVGPDLSAIGASSQLDYLIESILTPNKVIREGYNSAIVTTTTGKTITGIVLRESPQDLVLRTTSADEITIPVKSIDERTPGASLMPAGLIEFVTDAELVDLVRFLSELGKPGPFQVSHRPIARRWQTLAKLPDDFASFDAPALGKALSTDASLTWKPLLGTVSGDISLAEIAVDKSVILRTHLDVTTPGVLTLGLSQPNVTIWVDGALTKSPTLDLTAGLHVLTFRLEANAKTPTFRCELRDTADSKATGVFK